MFSFLLLIIYLAFISLGLPDAVMGAAWPVMHEALGVSTSAMAPVGLIISIGTVLSSLISDRLTRRIGTGLVTAVSVLLTAVGLLGFGLSTQYWMLFLWAIPYGFGAGSVDAALNNYVAIHYASRHMSWLHCMWGIGASAGPYIMSFVLARQLSWNTGYFILAFLQILLTGVLFFSLPKWKSDSQAASREKTGSTSTGYVFRLPGLWAVMLMFFCYCALETLAGQWSANYLVAQRQFDPETAAAFAGIFYLGLTGGRLLSGFLTFRLQDGQMILLGLFVMMTGIVCLLIPGEIWLAAIALVLIGLGCAPIYPCSIHATPGLFGTEWSQSVIGMQMASAFCGTCLIPPLYGALSDLLGSWIMPLFLLIGCCVMFIARHRIYRSHP